MVPGGSETNDVIACDVPIRIDPFKTVDIVVTQSQCHGLGLAFGDPAALGAVLWWPHQMGAPTMQRLRLELLDEAGAVLDALQRDVGLRIISAENDENGHRLFRVNNEKLLIRGGGYAEDLFLRFSKERFRAEVNHARNLGLNTIRMEGKFPDDAFFDTLSGLGMLAMPGICCCDAWQNWDLWPQENDIISFDSVKTQLLRLRQQPSVAAFLLSSDLLPPASVEKSYRSAAAEAHWPNPIIAAAASGESTLNGESTGVKMLGPYAWVPPSYWNDPVAKEDYGGAVGFSTEISPGGAPLTLESWLRTAGGSDAWCPADGGPMSDAWNFHCGNQHGVFRSLNYFVPPLESRYGGDFTASEVVPSPLEADGDVRCALAGSKGNGLVSFLRKSQLMAYVSSLRFKFSLP